MTLLRPMIAFAALAAPALAPAEFIRPHEAAGHGRGSGHESVDRFSIHAPLNAQADIAFFDRLSGMHDRNPIGFNIWRPFYGRILTDADIMARIDARFHAHPLWYRLNLPCLSRLLTGRDHVAPAAPAATPAPPPAVALVPQAVPPAPIPPPSSIPSSPSSPPAWTPPPETGPAPVGSPPELSPPPQATPEPTSWGLFALGGLLLLARARAAARRGTGNAARIDGGSHNKKGTF
jgi:hypothetical protein